MKKILLCAAMLAVLALSGSANAARYCYVNSNGGVTCVTLPW